MKKIPFFFDNSQKPAMKLPGNHLLHQTEQLLCSLTDAIPRVQAFRGKWAAIRAKLADFPTQLSDLAEFSTSPLASELVHSISETLVDALSLAGKCLNPNPVDGKLRTQSDVDSITAKIDQHVKDIEVLTKAGITMQLQENGTVGFGAIEYADSVRDESRNLVTRLQIGDSESRNSAMDSLLGLLYEDDESVVIAVAQGVVPILVSLLDSSSLEIKEKAVSAISRVSMVDSCRHELVTEGLSLIGLLVRILESRSGFAKEKACVALQALSFSRENARAIGSKAGIASLLEICQSETPYSQASAAALLRNLSSYPENKQNFMEEEDAIPILIGVAASGTLVAQENVIGCLCNLVCDDEELKLVVAREGVIECLRCFWDMAPTIETLEVAIELVKSLATCRPIREAIVSEGFLARLAGALSCGVARVRIAAAGAVQELGCGSKARKEMGEAGIVAELVKMLEAKMIEEKEMATKALSSLMFCGSNRKIFIQEERAIELTVELLDPSIPVSDKQCVISVLASIANSSNTRKQIVAAGACAHLQKLIEMNLHGAKKLFESLDRSNSWGLFTRRL